MPHTLPRVAQIPFAEGLFTWPSDEPRTFTTQDFRPKEPYRGPEDPGADWQGYGVGYIELGDAIRVESRLTEHDPSKLHIGMEMELRIVPFGTDDDGNELVNFAFAPADR